MRDKKNLDADGPLPYFDKTATRLYRIFSDGRFDRGGRFYRGWWMGIPKEYRAKVTIDGMRTVELDYSQYHISMVYAELGLELTFNPYSVLPEYNKVIRDITKRTVNALLNAKGMINPVEGFGSKIVGMDWDRFVNKVIEAHPVMVEHGRFMTGYGLSLHYQDSLIAESVMMHFAKRRIPCLPIHDSFIVSEEYAEELGHVMQGVYRRTFNQPITVK